MAIRSDRSPQQAFEESILGRRVLSGFVTLTVLAIIVWNLPASELKDTISPYVAPYVTSAGLSQSWRIFAPNLRRTDQSLYARVEYSDGDTAIWSPPGDRALGAVRTERWRKFLDVARQDSSADLWNPLARHIAREHVSGGVSPTSVTLVRASTPVPEPGSDDQPESGAEEFYTLLLDPETGREVSR